MCLETCAQQADKIMNGENMREKDGKQTGLPKAYERERVVTER